LEPGTVTGVAVAAGGATSTTLLVSLPCSFSVPEVPLHADGSIAMTTMTPTAPYTMRCTAKSASVIRGSPSSSRTIAGARDFSRSKGFGRESGLRNESKDIAVRAGAYFPAPSPLVSVDTE